MDDVVTEADCAWAAAREAPTLLVHVDHREGLRRTHFDELLAWAAALSGIDDS